MNDRKLSIVVVVLLFVSVINGIGANLLSNPGFESGENGYPAGWTTWASAWQKDWAALTGSNGLAFYGWTDGGGAYQDVAYSGPSNYAFSIYGFCDESFTNFQVALKLEFFDAQDTMIDSKVEIISGQAAWIQYSVIASSPTGTVSVRPVLMFKGDTGTGGAFKWDDAELVSSSLATDDPVFYVSSCGSHTFPYTNWAMAANDIQSAVDAAPSGEMVLVTNGLYNTGGMKTPGSEWMNRVCITNAITVQSVNGPEVTVIAGVETSGGGCGTNAIRGVFMANGATLIGFTVTNGHTSADGGGVLCSGTATLSNCVLSGNTASGNGGGVNGGSLVNCKLIGNASEHDGGGSAYAELDDCTLSGNTAITGGGAFFGRLTNCVLMGNGAVGGGGAQYATLFNCILTSNTASSAGGGANTCTLTSCLLNRNSSLIYGGGAQYGYLFNCLLIGNTAHLGGGLSGGYKVYNCTLSDNAASGGGGGIHDVGGMAAVNCIIWGNHCTNNSNRANYFCAYPVYSCTTPMPMPVPYPTGSNIVANPLFVDPANGNYHLQATSPCLNMGNNAFAPTNASQFDLAGNPRIYMDVVDMGAYEFFKLVGLGISGEVIESTDHYRIRYTISLTNYNITVDYMSMMDVLPDALKFVEFESDDMGWGYWGDQYGVLSYSSDYDKPVAPGSVLNMTFLAETVRAFEGIAITNDVGSSYAQTAYGTTHPAATCVVYLPDSDGDGISNLKDPDDDNDGMADYWENYYGLDLFDASDADDDPDGDGRTNLTEFQDHTDPGTADTPTDGQPCLVDNRDPNCSDITGFPFRTIQAAMYVVMPNELIEVADGVYTGNYFLARDLDLRGSDATFIESASTTSIFNIPAGINASIAGFNFQGVTNETPPVMINAGNVVLSNVVVSSCLNKAEYYHSGSGGSFIRGGKGVLRNETGATMRVHRSTFDGNYSSGRALYNTTAYGGAICNYGLLQVSESTLSSNLCDSGWNYHRALPSYGGAIYNGGTAEIDACTFHGNRVVGGSMSMQACGRPGYGGAICSDGPLTITRSTLSGNTAASHFNSPGVGGAIYATNGAVYIDSCTIIDNSADIGGGIRAGSNVVIRNTILANNSAETGPDASGTLISAGYNLIGSISNLTLLGETSTVLLNVNPWLAPIADNNGPTWTCALRVNSPAIDAGSCGISNTPDQRGMARPSDGTTISNAFDGCDIGAYEFDWDDADGDSLFNDWERQYGFDPNSGPDTDLDPDKDTLSNLEELHYYTDPTKADTDDDTIRDDEEVFAGADGFVTDPLDEDTDHDGMPDPWEIQNLLHPVNADDADDDPDQDYLMNLDEYREGGDPQDSDMDDDGLLDGWEIDNGLAITNTSAPLYGLNVVKLGSYKEANWGTYDGVQGVVAAGDYVYLAAETNGLIVLDCSIASNPVKVAQYPFLNLTGISMYSNTLCVMDCSRRLNVFDISIPDHPVWQGMTEFPGFSVRMQVYKDVAYIRTLSSGNPWKLRYVDLSTPTNPVVSGSYTWEEVVESMYAADDRLYISLQDPDDNYHALLHVLDISDPLDPVLLSSSETRQRANALCAVDGLLFTAAGYLDSYDVSNPSNVLALGCSSETSGKLLEVTNNYAVVASSYKVRFFDVSAPGNLPQCGCYSVESGYFRDTAVKGTTVYAAHDKLGLFILEYSIRDSDADGLDDLWEQQHFGNLDACTYEDPDGDGIPNWGEQEAELDPNCADSDYDGMSDGDEMRAGCRPDDSSSSLCMEGQLPLTNENTGITVQWTSTSGRRYELLRSSNLLEGFGTIAAGIPATPPRNTYCDETATNDCAYFYKVEIKR